MRKTKKLMAVALAATMVLGSGVTVFADETGSTTGTGSSEGHVEKEVTNVVLPTVAEGSSPFEYIMDPERLIQGTDAKKYADGTVFPDEDDDTGVYFLVGDKTYSNTSSTLQAINKSSCDIKLTVSVATTKGSDKDITLTTTDQVSSSAAELYLELKVGSDTKAVADEGHGPVSFEKVIAGSPNNFEVAVKKGSYVYQEKKSATDWKAMNISMTGAVSAYQIAADTTAPTVEVTWSWTKAGDSDSASADAVDYSTAPDNSSAGEVVIPEGDGNATIAVTIGKDKATPVIVSTDWFEANLLTYDVEGWGVTYDADKGIITFGSGISEGLRGNPSHKFWITFEPENGGETYWQELTCRIAPEQSYAGEIVVPESGNVTVAITIGQNNAVPTKVSTDWFEADLLTYDVEGWNVSYDAVSKTLIFGSGISDGIREDQSHKFYVELTPTDGEEPYWQDLVYSE